VPPTEVQTLDLSALGSRQGWQGGGDLSFEWVVADSWVEDRGGCDEVDFNSTVAVSNSYLN
jgi:hypothetical protein